MRILFLSRRFPYPPDNGSKIRVVNLSKGDSTRFDEISMRKILVIGYELPSMAVDAIEARSYRTWQFVEPLLADGHQVCLIVSREFNELNLAHRWGSALGYHHVNLQTLGWLKRVRRLHDQFNPDGILAVTFNSCLRATRLSTNRPIWMDIYGDRLAESQVTEHTRNSNRGHRNMFRFLRMVLEGGDVYSTCSTPQKNALVGQLGMMSRLSRHTLGYEFVHPILPGVPADIGNIGNGISLRGDSVPRDAFIVLWCGSYNVWTDVEALFHGLCKAMSRDPRIVFVSVGGAAKIAQNDAYERFLSMIQASPHHQRFHMLGWRPAREVPGYYSQADAGINLDAFHYETLLGTRTRLVEMMRYGLPVITSLGCELSTIIRDQALGLTFPIGDADALCNNILEMAANSVARKKLADKAKSYVLDQLSFARTTEPFRRWAQDPYHAPDRLQGRMRCDSTQIEYFLRSILRQMLWRLWALERGD